MGEDCVNAKRVSTLRGGEAIRGGDFVLYWMQASQRESGNHALEFALAKANALKLPLLTAFCVADVFPGANKRHYAFMAEGLANAARRLEARGLAFEIFRGDPPERMAELAKKAALITTDAGHLRIQRRWREKLAKLAPCPLFEVEANLVVPVNEASLKEEYSARTIRPKILRLVPELLREPKAQHVATPSAGKSFGGERISSPEELLRGMNVDGSVAKSECFAGGEDEAGKLLRKFVGEKLAGYESDRNDPSLDGTSQLSAYLHFGNISPVGVALAALTCGKPLAEPFLEQLIVRRELAFNFVRRNPRYDSFEGLPEWAVKTLREHSAGRKRAVYTREELECALTDDPAWNAAQLEVLRTGRMHGYMRMYWGKRLLDWEASPEEAFKTALELNDKYELDGRDPNGYAGVAWCFGKHDRPWAPGGVFGTVRRMGIPGLRRKFDLDAYIAKAESLA